jgi:CBS domain-containing protein
VAGAVDREFLHVVSNDCLTNLPPMTFFQNMVLDEAGEETSVFRLEETALRPLVHVGRVFGLATRKTFGTSTLERFATAQKAWPAQAAIFREASEALRIVLWQQGRVGIREETGGAELPPSLLGAYDRQLLKSCFRSIMRLLEFTGELEWLKTL